MTFTFEHHLKALVYLSLYEYESGRELLQVMEQDNFARSHITPPEGVSRSTFFEAMNTMALFRHYPAVFTQQRSSSATLHA
jgi:hypothetical protein